MRHFENSNVIDNLVLESDDFLLPKKPQKMLLTPKVVKCDQETLSLSDLLNSVLTPETLCRINSTKVG
jgi:hypothetical protein